MYFNIKSLSHFLTFIEILFIQLDNFYVVTLRRGRPRPRPREQLLLQNYKA